jgi:uncharacterized protein
VKYIALYPKKGEAPINGVTCYGKIIDVKFVKRFEIAEFPRNSSEEYVKKQPSVVFKEILRLMG